MGAAPSEARPQRSEAATHALADHAFRQAEVTRDLGVAALLEVAGLALLVT
jgi:hypothetical protein